MSKKKILIEHFSNLNNYGTAMMGLVTIQRLAERWGAEQVEFYFYPDEYTDKAQILSELRPGICLSEFRNEAKDKWHKAPPGVWKKWLKWKSIFFNNYSKAFDMIISLGGDDFSEYYFKKAVFFDILEKWKNSFHTQVVLLGQTIGPFQLKLNRWGIKYLLPRLAVYARDPWTVTYLRQEFGLSVRQIADLALCNLPLQGDKNIETNILDRYRLVAREYITVIVSGMQADGYYCRDRGLYLKRFVEILEMIAKEHCPDERKIVLLAHTFPPYGDEPGYIADLWKLLPCGLKSKIVVVKEKILPTRARFILGNSLYVLTGRMHPAVSALQMGTPAICLSYSVKYKGVIGESLGREDLIVEAGEERIWQNGEIVSEIREKLLYLSAHLEKIKSEIREIVKRQRELLDGVWKEL